ncbi:eukaryotic initiation factor 4F subunit p150 [[Candida] jaroonii]|uniref:Eukaryotic initiation factor 4F subunit p150 n=1 Tax=[Candida] jaroonii TaxID=467808 RepID=A0ACA9YBA0_9ASCO|nr:eukaryotic initiation factor 4F subunit p150 [[Candida] jaroonii]
MSKNTKVQKQNDGGNESQTPLSTSNLQQHNSQYQSSTQSNQSPQQPSTTTSNNGNQRYNSNYNKHYNNRSNQNRQSGYKKSYKPNHHQNQYDYNAAAAAAYQQGMMYPYGGYTYGYPMMPMGYAPNPNSPTTMYNGMNPNPQLSASPTSIHSSVNGTPNLPTLPLNKSPQAFVPGKIKITDKDGKPVEFEDKKLKSSTTSPIASPAKSFASPIRPNTSLNSQPVPNLGNTASPIPKQPLPVFIPPAQTTTPAPPKPQPKPAASTGKDTVVLEDFKAKIARLAAAAKLKKEQELAAKEGRPIPQAEEPKEETKPKVEVKEEVKETVPEKEAKEPVVETKVETKEPVVESKTESKDVEPKVESKVEPKAEPVESKESESSEIPPTKSVEIQEPEGEQDDEDDEDDDEDDEEEEEPAQPEMDLSQFFDKIKDVDIIEDPYTMTYPEPLVGVDPKWKIEGKKFRYDPQFLIQFQNVVTFEVDEEWKNKLAGLGIVAQSNNRKYPPNMQRGGSKGMGRFNNSSRGGSNVNFENVRQNSRNGSKRRVGSSRDKSKRGGQSKRNRDGKDDQITIPPEEIKPLEKSANRWVPRSRAKTEEVKMAPDGVTPILNEEEIERKVKSLLNKLTLEMFDPITDEILKIMDQSKWEDDAQTVKQVIGLTFAKACDEPYWSSMYAQFCAKMVTRITDEVTVDDGQGGKKSGGDLARRLLLATCQKEYEKGWSDKLPKVEDGNVEMMSDEYYAMAAAKRRGLGLVKFIGQLFLLGMLNDKVVFYCLTNLSKNTEDPSEDSLESLAQLVTAVGPKFDSHERNKFFLSNIFESIQTILDKVKLPSRIKFMLMDLQDLRKAGWVSNKGDEGPKTIKEIHDDAEIKRLEDEKAAIERRRKGNKNLDSRSNSSRNNNSNWGSTPKRVESSSKLPIKDSKGFQSVSRSQSNRVDSNLNRENSKRTESTQSNMFAALGGDGEDHDHDHEQDQDNDEKETEKPGPIEI